MHSLRRIPGQPSRFLSLRTFSSSATRHEIRDVASLSQRLIPKYQGTPAGGGGVGDAAQDEADSW
jgi:hypothetical protein